MKYTLKDGDYLKLWTYFEDRAASVKGAMFNTLTWTLGLAAGIIAFIFVTAVKYDPTKAQLKLCPLVAVGALAGLLICLYAGFSLKESAKHIRRNWYYAEMCRREIEKLGDILNTDGGGPKELVEI